MQYIKSLLSVSACTFLIGCGSSDSSSTTNSSTSISSSLNMAIPANGNIFAANIGETTVNTYTFTGTVQNSGSTSVTASNLYSISVNGLNSAMSVVNNSCQNISSGSSCAISIKFAPTSQDHYSKNNTLNFTTSNSLIGSQTLHAITSPNTLSVVTSNYSDNKTSIMMSIGTGNAVKAEVDTGSQLVVADFNITNSSDYYSTIPSKYLQCYNAIASLAAMVPPYVTDANLSKTAGCDELDYGNGSRAVYGFYA